MSLANVHVSAVWLPESDRHVISVAIDDSDAVLPSLVLSREGAQELICRLLDGLAALKQLPGGAPPPEPPL